jgi:hypothetical protein
LDAIFIAGHYGTVVGQEGMKKYIFASKSFMRNITSREAVAFIPVLKEGEAGPGALVARCLPAASGHGGFPRLACLVPFRRG